MEHHFAHRERQDGRHSPSAVLRGVLGRTIPQDVLSRALYATQFTRQIDRHGYVRFKHWKFFGENGLAGEEVSVWIYEDTLKVEHQATTLPVFHPHGLRPCLDHRSEERPAPGNTLSEPTIGPL